MTKQCPSCGGDCGYGKKGFCNYDSLASEKSTDRQAAEQAYIELSPDFPGSPIGSREWCFFYVGWQAARSHTQHNLSMLEAPPLPEQCEELRAVWKCDSCDGTGYSKEIIPASFMQPSEYWPCSDCNGNGALRCEAYTSEQMRKRDAMWQEQVHQVLGANK